MLLSSSCSDELKTPPKKKPIFSVDVSLHIVSMHTIWRQANRGHVTRFGMMGNDADGWMAIWCCCANWRSVVNVIWDLVWDEEGDDDKSVSKLYWLCDTVGKRKGWCFPKTDRVCMRNKSHCDSCIINKWLIVRSDLIEWWCIYWYKKQKANRKKKENWWKRRMIILVDKKSRGKLWWWESWLVIRYVWMTRTKYWVSGRGRTSNCGFGMGREIICGLIEMRYDFLSRIIKLR